MQLLRRTRLEREQSSIRIELSFFTNINYYPSCNLYFNRIPMNFSKFRIPNHQIKKLLQSYCLVKSFESIQPKYFSISVSKMVDKIALDKNELDRYSRQILCPEFGVEGQKRLKSSSVLIVGAGGLGCPSSQYLVAAGIGRIGFVDSDRVELSNLHRQILHSEKTIGHPKTESAINRLQELNSNVKFEKHQIRFNASNAFNIIQEYDLVIDATDNPGARYLLNDVCFISQKPLISGSALRFEGQLTVYHYNKEGPCYRCLFPQPPQTVTSCAEGGVMGVVPGIIGNLQALEAIKISSGMKPSYAGILLLFDALSGNFRQIQLRNRQDNCITCGKNPTITRNNLMDYDKFCGSKSTDSFVPLSTDERITCEEYQQILKSNQSHLLIDVRPPEQMNIPKLDHAYSITVAAMSEPNGMDQIDRLIEEKFGKQDQDDSKKGIYFICRRGFASQKAYRLLEEHLRKQGKIDSFDIKDVIGGMEAMKVIDEIQNN
ncbi:hypothetical protein NH340_JMT02682 [Sarcoptes scabiei]|nr:hypothetical protein NH340_JMT02682 [Sarcoptes scabiei]